MPGTILSAGIQVSKCEKQFISDNYKCYEEINQGNERAGGTGEVGQGAAFD